MRHGISDIYRQVNNFFVQYASEYLSGDEDLRRNTILKRDHTIRVCALASQIAASLRLEESDAWVAKLVALLHDIGRFEQYAAYRTFSDLHSENHSAVALRVIEEHALLSALSADERNLVLRAIELHNVQFLPDGLDERTILHAKIVRDADKLDILPIVLDYQSTRHIEKNPAMEGKLPDTPGVSPEIVELILASETISNGIRRNRNDVLLVQMAWLTDLNFPWSYRYAADRRFADRMRAFLPDDPLVERAYGHVSRTVKAGAEKF